MQTIGERLEEARKKKGISIREAAEATKIRGDYLQRFESNQFDIGLTEIYTRGFLRNYANFLKVPAERILSDYAALGRGDVRPRQPNREIYGRMDITVASAGESSDRAAPPEGGAAEPASASHSQPRYPRGSGSSLPSGPDPATVFKYVKIGGIAVAAIVAILVIKSLFSGKSTPAAPVTNANPPAAATPSAPAAGVLVLHALNPVKVEVRTPNGTILFDGLLARDETRTLRRESALNITASAAENLQFGFGGPRWLMSDKTGPGYQSGNLPAP